MDMFIKIREYTNFVPKCKLPIQKQPINTGCFSLRGVWDDFGTFLCQTGINNFSQDFSSTSQS